MEVRSIPIISFNSPLNTAILPSSASDPILLLSLSPPLLESATDNPYHSSTFGNSEHDPNDYIGIASVFPPQTAKAEMLHSLRDVEVGDKNGNGE